MNINIRNWVAFCAAVAVGFTLLILVALRALPVGAAPEVTPTAQAAPLLAPAPTNGASTTSAVVTSVSEPMRFRAFVPDLKEYPKTLKGTKNVRVVLEFEAKDAEQVQKAFAQKGVPFYLDVRPIR